jgi:aspartate racemase
MNTVGIIGGIGPESTIEYYRLIISSYLERDESGNYPRVIINSINMKKMLDLIGTNRLTDVVEYISGEILKLGAAGADFAVLASNTPHIVFNHIREKSPIPMISIVEATCKKANDMGLKRVGLFGTRFTMQGGFYDEIFFPLGIEVFTPEQNDREYIHAKYMNELVKGIILDETREELINIAEKMKKSHEIQGLILGGTELPLVLNETGVHGIPFLDTTLIHVENIIEKLI